MLRFMHAKNVHPDTLSVCPRWAVKLNGLDPALYLRTVLAKLPEHPINQIQQLLPWNLAPSLQNDPSRAA
jgi:IS66 C-terminal element